jgi:hypothetical protein
LPRQPHERGRHFELQTDKTIAARTFMLRMRDDKTFGPRRHSAKTDTQRECRQKNNFPPHTCMLILQSLPFRVNTR